MILYRGIVEKTFLKKFRKFWFLRFFLFFNVQITQKIHLGAFLNAVKYSKLINNKCNDIQSLIKWYPCFDTYPQNNDTYPQNDTYPKLV